MKTTKENSGSAISGVANVILGIGVIISIVLGILPLVTMSKLGNGGVGFIVFVVIVGVGCLISWIISIFMRGFGEIVQYTAESATYLEAIDDLTASKTNEVASPATTSTPTNVTNQNQVRCEVCGTMNHYRNKACISCGHSFEH